MIITSSEMSSCSLWIITPLPITTVTLWQDREGLSRWCLERSRVATNSVIKQIIFDIYLLYEQISKLSIVIYILPPAALRQPFPPVTLPRLSLSASGPAAVSDVWYCDEAHRCESVGGLRPPGQHPLLRPLHLLVPLTPGIQPAAGRPVRVLQHLRQWPAAGGGACQWQLVYRQI